jgi:hypothetical protein
MWNTCRPRPANCNLGDQGVQRSSSLHSMSRLPGDARAGEQKTGGSDGGCALEGGAGRRLAHGTPGAAVDEHTASARRPDTPSAPAVASPLSPGTPPSPPTPWSADSRGLLWSADDVVSAASTPENPFVTSTTYRVPGLSALSAAAGPPDDPSSWSPRDHLVPQHPRHACALLRRDVVHSSAAGAHRHARSLTVCSCAPPAL